MLAAQSNVPGTGTDELSTLNGSWKNIIEPVEPFLASVHLGLADQVKAFDAGLAPYAEYALKGNGKHLRPTLVALSANSLGKITEAHTTVAVIIEMVHLATLVHDDVMDEAEIRRGRLTLAANWGNEVAVLFGDCLFAHALKLAAGFPTPDICRAVASATNTVCSGEILQTQHRRDFDGSRRDYIRVLEMKTGELFGLSCELAARLSGASDAQREGLRQFGMAFGTAYQIYDDCVDLFGEEAEAGKSLGTDLAKGKLTLPLLLAWERATPEDRGELEAIVRDWRPERFARVTELLSGYNTFAPSLETIRRYNATARHALAPLAASEGRSGLMALTEFLNHQTESLAGQRQ
jgi:octaprenyl-diphosphate synthase